MPRFMTKKEKEARELQDKKQKAFKEKQKRMKELQREVEEMQALVREKVKDPAIRRRNTIAAYGERPKPMEDEDPVLPSCFGEGADFYKYRLNKEEERFGRLEWRAQFTKIEPVARGQRERRQEEK